MLKHVNSKNFQEEVINSQRAVLVDFFATWCGPCQMLAPVLEKISSSRADFDIAKVDIDEAQDLAYKYGIQVVPTMVICKDGKVMKKIEGYHNENEIASEMAEYV